MGVEAQHEEQEFNYIIMSTILRSDKVCNTAHGYYDSINGYCSLGAVRRHLEPVGMHSVNTL